MVITGRILVAAVFLATSCFVIANTLIESQPITIVFEDESHTVVDVPILYGETKVLTLIIASCIAGISATFLYFQTSKTSIEFERRVTTRKPIGSSPKLEAVETALRILTGPKKRILEILVNKEGEMLQKDLYLETNFSKAKISRTLRQLELRNIIVRKHYGSTKKIILSDWMKNSIA